MLENVILVCITAGLSILATLYYPKLKRANIQRRTRKNQKLTSLIKAEVERQLKDIIND